MSMNFCPKCAHPLETREIDGRPRVACTSSTCDYVFWNNPTPVVAAIVEHDGHVVLTRSQGWPEGRFGLVAGFLEASEHPDDAVLREVKEELGLDGRIESFIGYYSFGLRNQLLFVFHVTAAGVITVAEELAEIKRVPPPELKPWPMGTGPALRDWMIRRGLPV